MSSSLASFLDEITDQADHATLASLKSHPNGVQQVIEYISSIVQSSASVGEVDIFLNELCDQDVKGCVPDADYSAAWKSMGNAAFAKEKYEVAMENYQKALRFLDETQDGLTASRLYTNRALCLERLQQFGDAIQDATCAIRCDPTFAKAYWRRAMAHKALKQYESALADAEKTLQLQEAQNEDTAATVAIITTLQQHISSGTGIKAEPQWTTHTVPLEVQDARTESASSGLGGAGQAEDAANSAEKNYEDSSPRSIATASAVARSLSSMLNVEESEACGRQLVMNATVPAATDLYSETPFAHTNTKSARLKVCSQCCKHLPPSSPQYYCPRCPLVAYCSPTCRDADVFHRPGGPECGRPWTALLPHEVILCLRLARKLASSQPTDLTRLVSSLETGLETMQEDSMAHFAALAYIAHQLWQRTIQQGAVASASEAALTPHQVFKAACQVQTNGVALVPCRQGGQLDRFGLAVYGGTSLINHACVPNVAMRFVGNRVTVRSVSEIPTGSPLLHCYGPQVGEMTARQRILFLQDIYGFVCRCASCVNPPASDAALVGLRCKVEGCKGAISPPEDLDRGLVSRYPYEVQDRVRAGSCSQCGTTLPAPEWTAILQDLQTGKELMEQGFKALSEDDFEGALKALLRSVQCTQHLHELNQQRGAVENALAMAYHNIGRPAQAVAHLRKSLAVVEAHYPAGSTNVAYEHLALATVLGDIAKQGGGPAEQEATRLSEGAFQALKRHFGEDSALEDHRWALIMW